MWSAAPRPEVAHEQNARLERPLRRRLRNNRRLLARLGRQDAGGAWALRGPLRKPARGHARRCRSPPDVGCRKLVPLHAGLDKLAVCDTTGNLDCSSTTPRKRVKLHAKGPSTTADWLWNAVCDYI